MSSRFICSKVKNGIELRHGLWKQCHPSHNRRCRATIARALNRIWLSRTELLSQCINVTVVAVTALNSKTLSDVTNDRAQFFAIQEIVWCAVDIRNFWDGRRINLKAARFNKKNVNKLVHDDRLWHMST